MKAFRTFSMVVVALSIGASFALGQSLAEVAKKEKKRRQDNKEEATRVITDRELTYGYGGGPATASTVTVPGQSEEGDGEGDGASASGESAEQNQDDTQGREYWTERVSAAKDKIAGLEQRLQEGDWGEGIGQGTDPRGANRLQQRQELEQQLANARAELEGVRTEGRRAGVPPGWLR